MTRTDVDGIKASVCGSCFGTWLSPVALLRRVREDVAEAKAAGAGEVKLTLADVPEGETEADEAAAGAGKEAGSGDDLAPNLPPLADLVDIVTESNNPKEVRCPECEKPMHKDRFQQMIPVTVDRCKHCDRMWLDTGKFNLIRRLYVEMTLSTDPKIAALREKIAGVQVQWQGREAMKDSGSAGGSTAMDVAAGVDLSLRVLFALLR